MSIFCSPRLIQIFALMALCILSVQSVYATAAIDTRTEAGNHQKTITVCSEPITLKTTFNSILGLTSATLKDAVVQAIQTLGYQAEFIEQPWLRCIQMVKNNIVDVLMASAWEEERSQSMVYPLNKVGLADTTRRAWVSYYSIFTTQDSRLTWDGEKIQGIKHGVGSPLGYMHTEKLRELGVLNKHVVSAQAGLKLVAKGLLDGFATERTIGYSHIDAIGLHERIVELPTPFFQQNLYTPLSTEFYHEDSSRGEQFFDLVSEYHKQTLQ